MSPLNYDKWGKIELSDDSDIEGHPNVDHKSLVRWKQRDIHEKRQQRKATINFLIAQIACDSIILPRIKAIAKDLHDVSSPVPRTKYFSNLFEKLEKEPSGECPPGSDPTKLDQTYDGMILNLMRGVTAEAQQAVQTASADEKEEKLAKALTERVDRHVKDLAEVIEVNRAKLEEEKAELQKKITSDDLQTGFDSTNVGAADEPEPVPKSKVSKPKAPKATVTEFQTIHPGAAAPADPSAATSSSPPTAVEEEEVDTDDEGLPELTPALEEFSHLPLRGFQKSFDFIQSHRQIFAKGSSDALLVAAFRAQSAMKPKYAKKCIHQSLLIQYCDKLGPDGVRMFFSKMIKGDQRAQRVFLDDMENTYRHLVERVIFTKAEEAAAGEGQEQIQLVAEDPSTVISFNVPDGPPPEDLRLEGEGTEDLDIEEVRKALTLRWQVFEAFPQDFQEALKTGELVEVNKVLGELGVPEAEKLVEALDYAGILNFAGGDSTIRDETGKVEPEA